MFSIEPQCFPSTTKLAPGGFLPKEKTFLESELSLMRKEMEVKNFESEVLSFAGF